MSLRSQLTTVLNEILPSNPSEAVKGTELIRLLRTKIGEDYSDASLRYHFSVMSCDPASPIAKVEKGQGYYKRGLSMPALAGASEIFTMQQAQLDDIGQSSTLDQVMLRREKFRAIIRKYNETQNLFTFEFHDSLGVGVPLGNLWKFPEMVIIDWEHGEFDDDGMTLDAGHLALKKSLGLPPYQLACTRMRVETTHDTFRQDLFQTMSAAMWANQGQLYLADSIHDEFLAGQVRSLAMHLGVGVTSFGLPPQALDNLPYPAHIENAMERETEALMGRLRIEVVAPATNRTHCEWKSLQALRRQHPEMNHLLAWLGGSLETHKVRPYQAYRPAQPEEDDFED